LSNSLDHSWVSSSLSCARTSRTQTTTLKLLHLQFQLCALILNKDAILLDLNGPFLLLRYSPVAVSCSPGLLLDTSRSMDLLRNGCLSWAHLFCSKFTKPVSSSPLRPLLLLSTPSLDSSFFSGARAPTTTCLTPQTSQEELNLRHLTLAATPGFTAVLLLWVL